MKIKRFVLSCLVTGALLTALAGSVGAADPEHANCFGQVASSGLYSGQDRAGAARANGGLGQLTAPLASSNCDAR